MAMTSTAATYERTVAPLLINRVIQMKTQDNPPYRMPKAFRSAQRHMREIFLFKAINFYSLQIIPKVL
jgi:hypothetical protein